jgi:hypothetical protein
MTGQLLNLPDKKSNQNQPAYFRSVRRSAHARASVRKAWPKSPMPMQPFAARSGFCQTAAIARSLRLHLATVA